MRTARPLHVAAWQHAAAKPDGFTYQDIAEAAGISVANAMKTVKRWLDDGRVETAEVRPDRRIVFRVTPGGVEKAAEEVAGGPVPPEAAIWRAMRGLGVFCPRDVVTHIPPEIAVLTEDEVRRYCLGLLKAGYLKVVRKAVPPARPAFYRLIRNTGPMPPMERRTVIVHDPNLDQIVYVAPVKP